ncbi:MAG: hypothetical protein JKY57_04135 [Kordiimonadaceae bacterium]|nr:hypothetical protein [Kordiimonadaceae bacterium]
MAEPFKDLINETVVRTTSEIFSRVYPAFDTVQFTREALDGLLDLELKERTQHIMKALDRTLPADFDAFAEITLAALHPSEDPGADGVEFGPEGICGMPAWPLTDLVTKRGIDCPEKALPLMKEVTKRFTAEFAIRPFLQAHTDFTLKTMESWLTDSNKHVRRLVSEGTRPRLPWGMRLHDFVSDPAPILPLLEALKDDEEEYVRRSVANNLNDIAKDHADMVANIATQWLKKANRDRERLVRHACRSLFKQGHGATLAAFGYQAVDGLSAALEVSTPVVNYGDALEFELDLSGGSGRHKLMIDYAIHFVKANGQTTPKVFKWKDTTLNAKGALSAAKKHAIKPITTRVYYPGTHEIEILVNGVSLAKQAFELKM